MSLRKIKEELWNRLIKKPRQKGTVDLLLLSRKAVWWWERMGSVFWERPERGRSRNCLRSRKYKTRIGWAKKHCFTQRNSLFELSFFFFFPLNWENYIVRKKAQKFGLLLIRANARRFCSSDYLCRYLVCVPPLWMHCGTLSCLFCWQQDVYFTDCVK